MTTTVDKIEGEIAVDLMEDIIKTLPNIAAINSADHSILIHGMGGQPRSFYNNLKQNESVELLWTGWSSNTWWTYVVSFIPGQTGLVKVLDRQQLHNLYLDIGGSINVRTLLYPQRQTLICFGESKKGQNSRYSRYFG